MGTDDLDYMHARYYNPWLGRFLGVDPHKVFAPRTQLSRWNRYVYAHNNPLVKVDPDGRDAIAVVFPNYDVQVADVPQVRVGNVSLGGTTLRAPLGHAGIVTIDGDGGTRYYEFGRYRPGGAVRRITIPDVQMGENGLPTEESLSNMLRFISRKSGQGGRVEASYFINGNEAAMNEFAESQESNSDPYSLSSNNCATFCENTLEAGGVSIEGLWITPDGFSADAQDAADFVVILDSAEADAAVECDGSQCPEEPDAE